eukprot:1161263-Pelagomonas_calceolata.AAC.22
MFTPLDNAKKCAYRPSTRSKVQSIFRAGDQSSASIDTLDGALHQDMDGTRISCAPDGAWSLELEGVPAIQGSPAGIAFSASPGTVNVC